jgi:hypothetical protein
VCAHSIHARLHLHARQQYSRQQVYWLKLVHSKGTQQCRLVMHDT